LTVCLAFDQLSAVSNGAQQFVLVRWRWVKESKGLLKALERVAPGTLLRAGLDRILLAKMGALIVMNDSPEVLELCSGGFLIESSFSPQRLFELAKMDGAIVLSENGSRIVRANVHLVPDPRLPTSETGTRHRTAERVAESVDATVVAVSEELSVISVYHGHEKRTLQPIPTLLSRANQALSTLERYRERLDSVLSSLDALEITEQVTFRDVLFVLQRAEMVRRIREEIEGYLVELGSDGRLVELQAAEITLGFDSIFDAVLFDFLGVCNEAELAAVKEFLSSIPLSSLMDPLAFGRGIAEHSMCEPLIDQDLYDRELLATPLESRGSRILGQVPRLPRSIVEKVKERFPSLKDLEASSVDDLAQIPGVGHDWAKSIKEYIASLGSNGNP
jgi:diadenylate cyclase